MEVQSDTDKVDVLEEGKRNKDGNKEQDNLSDSDFSMASSERSAAMGGNIKFGTPSSPPGCEWWFAPLLQIIKKICPDLPATTVKRMLLTEHLCYGTGVDTFVLQVTITVSCSGSCRANHCVNLNSVLPRHGKVVVFPVD